MGRYRSALALGVTALLVAGGALLAGCGEPPARRSLEAARNGRYVIRATSPNGAVGEALWHEGSYRAALSGRTGIAFYDAATGEIWVGDPETRTLRPTDIHELAAFDWWIPALLVAEYEDAMTEGAAGELVAQLDIGAVALRTQGPEGMPSSFVLTWEGTPTIELTYEYERVGEVAAQEVEPPADWARQEPEEPPAEATSPE